MSLSVVAQPVHTVHLALFLRRGKFADNSHHNLIHVEAGCIVSGGFVEPNIAGVEEFTTHSQCQRFREWSLARSNHYTIGFRVNTGIGRHILYSRGSSFGEVVRNQACASTCAYNRVVRGCRVGWRVAV